MKIIKWTVFQNWICVFLFHHSYLFQFAANARAISTTPPLTKEFYWNDKHDPNETVGILNPSPNNNIINCLENRKSSLYWYNEIQNR
jgi:hypothetical protein